MAQNEVLGSESTQDPLTGLPDLDNESTSLTIGRLYTAAFGRKPDESGLEFWTNVADNLLAGYKDIARQFIDSIEFSRVTPNDSSSLEFLSTMYVNIYGELPDTAELSYRALQLDSGVKDRTDVFIGFANSPANVALYETLA